MDFLEIFKAIILGMVEGLTEFAPVSSTGHMIIVDDLWLKSAEFLTQPVANTFKIVIQLGSILASVIVFKDRFIDILGLNRFFHKEKTHKRGEGHLNLLHVIVGIIPAGILGVLFNDYIDEHLFFSQTVAIGLILGAILMIYR